MGPIDGGQRRAFELEAYHVLWNLWCTSRRTAVDTSNWDSACELLQTYYTVNQARQNSEVCAMRIRYLEIAEPEPRLADFVAGPPPYAGLPDAPRQLAQARYQYQLARTRHPQREQQRRKELETTKALFAAVQATEARARAAELARRREWQQSRWPQGVVLDSDIYGLESLADQVDAQNVRIEAQVRALNDLLRDGLANLPGTSSAEITDDTATFASRVESLLTGLRLPRSISPAATVAYCARSRELAVEYQLPPADVVPHVQSYRYVKNQDRVVGKARSASQLKALYASTIAQLTLLSVAAILAIDAQRRIDAVVFSGVVEVQDPCSGQPIRPCLVAARITPAAFGELDLVNDDPNGCLRRLSAVVSSNPVEFVPVRPLPQ